MTSYTVFTLLICVMIGCCLANQTCTCTCSCSQPTQTTTQTTQVIQITQPVQQTPSKCNISVTTASGTLAPVGDICAGALIFEDNFDNLDMAKWQHENTLAGGGNWEFQWYTNNRSNTYAEDGVLYFRPTLTADEFGEAFLSSGTINLNGPFPTEECTNSLFFGCKRVGTPVNILNPIKSARIQTAKSFSFLYGRVEISAQLPAGDWLWPALWFMPTRDVYGLWPASGEINMMESRGNLNLVRDGVNIGTEQVGSTLHYGPNSMFKGFETFTKNSARGNGFHLGYHRYQMDWTPDYIKFSVDDVETARIPAGFWDRGGFAQNAPGVKNPWRLSSGMAPFDQEFFLVMNLAVGGISYFPDEATNPSCKPWSNKSPKAATDFWNGRDDWLPTWNLNVNHSKGASLKVDYVRIWAL